MLNSSSFLRRPELGQTYCKLLHRPSSNIYFGLRIIFSPLTLVSWPLSIITECFYPTLIPPPQNHPPTQMYRKEKITLGLGLVTLEFLKISEETPYFLLRTQLVQKNSWSGGRPWKSEDDVHWAQYVLYSTELMVWCDCFQIWSATWKSLF